MAFCYETMLKFSFLKCIQIEAAKSLAAITFRNTRVLFKLSTGKTSVGRILNNYTKEVCTEAELKRNRRLQMSTQRKQTKKNQKSRAFRAFKNQLCS